MEKQEGKSDVAKREEAVLAFWKENKIFEKTLEKDAPKGDFIFYDGPPFATGLPHHGSLLSSIIKDVIPRYKTMRGYRVPRRFGWDCHGLPIENLIEKRLNLKTKKDIEKIGIATFNEAARASVLEFEHEWERYISRVGRFVDFKNSYKTMDNGYIESVWWALKRLHKKGSLYEGRKVLMYCPRCETPLAKAEIAMDNTYKDITEEAVTVKFKIKNPARHQLGDNTYLLAWTTTPWTLPGNVALAVKGDIEYVLVEKDGEQLVMAKDRHDGTGTIISKFAGSKLFGLEYEPLYEIRKLQEHKGKKHVVVPADFVTTEEGTGIVHEAPMYGEDDFALGQREGLPMVQILDGSARYNEEAPEFLRGRYIKDAEADIKADLEKRGLLESKANHTHSYPHCYRCGTPLIYNAVSSWFINIQKVKSRMLALNEKVNWVPKHLKHGRFKNIVETAPDWTISRSRFWASPLPIWKDQNGTVHLIGSLEELKRYTKKSGNRYFIMRHGEADNNAGDVLSGLSNTPHHLTPKGREEVRKTAESIKNVTFDYIFASPFVRTQETAAIVCEVIGFDKNKIITDERLGEIKSGVLEGKSPKERAKLFATPLDEFMKSAEGAENLTMVKKRMAEVLYEIENKYQNKKILIISHGDPVWMMISAGVGADNATTATTLRSLYPKTGEAREIDFVPLPHNGNYELDFHRPYIDELTVVDRNGNVLTRIKDVVDCWVESGAMPFASLGYPRDRSRTDPMRWFGLFPKGYPGDFIAEYIAQTRTWFYYMHALGTLLFNREAFKNVVSTGTVLAEGGAKISKSKGNYTDPLLLLDQYGADAYRFHLLGSVVLQAEDLVFRDEDIRESYNRVAAILWNCYSFYQLYALEYDGKTEGRDSSHILDRWIYARLEDSREKITTAFDAYDLPLVCRVIRAFVEDYSTWYVRRSRERVKGEGKDKQFALSVQRDILITFSKLIAPVMPFMSENVYLNLSKEKESVHLEAWPEGQSIVDSRELIENMKLVREIVSLGLEARARANIKVRQPLQKLSVYGADIGEEFFSLIRDEMNIKEVVLEKSDALRVELDTAISPELKEEGAVRDVVRAIQDLRKKAALKPSDTIVVTFGGRLPFSLEKWRDHVSRSVKASSVKESGEERGEAVDIGGEKIFIAISRI